MGRRATSFFPWVRAYGFGFRDCAAKDEEARGMESVRGNAAKVAQLALGSRDERWWSSKYVQNADLKTQGLFQPLAV